MSQGAVRNSIVFFALLASSNLVGATEKAAATRPAIREMKLLDTSVQEDADRLLRQPPTPFADDIADAASAAMTKWFRSLASSEDPQALVRLYASKFGNGDWREDLRFVLMAPHIAVPGRRFPWRMGVGGGDEGSRRSAAILRLANEVARTQVNRATRDPGYLQRLHLLSLCYGSFGVGKHHLVATQHFLISINKGSKDADGAAIWWHIRNFLVLCHALNLDGLSAGVTPENFRQKVERLTDLYETFYTQGMVVAADGRTWLPALANGEVTPIALPDRPFLEGPQLKLALLGWVYEDLASNLVDELDPVVKRLETHGSK